MMASGDRKKVIDMKNGQGKTVCVVVEEKNGQTCLQYKNKGDVYAYTDNEVYVKGRQNEKGYVFEMPIENIKAVTAESEEGRFVGYLDEMCELKPFEKTEEKAEYEEKINPYQSVVKEYEEMKKEESAAESFRKILDMFSKEMEEIEEENIITPADIVYIENGRKKLNAEDMLFENSSPIVPFEDSDFDWVMVSMDDMRTTSVKSRCLLNDMVMLSEIKYHHLALGRNRIDGKYVFAVPEKFAPEDKKHAKELGFKDFWFCSRENSPFGYWIMDI